MTPVWHGAVKKNGRARAGTLCVQKRTRQKQTDKTGKKRKRKSTRRDGSIFDLRTYGISFFFFRLLLRFCRLIERHTKLPTHKPPRPHALDLLMMQARLGAQLLVLLRHHVGPLQVPVGWGGCGCGGTRQNQSVSPPVGSLNGFFTGTIQRTRRIGRPRSRGARPRTSRAGRRSSAGTCTDTRMHAMKCVRITASTSGRHDGQARPSTSPAVCSFLTC